MAHYFREPKSFRGVDCRKVPGERARKDCKKWNKFVAHLQKLRREGLIAQAEELERPYREMWEFEQSFRPFKKRKKGKGKSNNALSAYVYAYPRYTHHYFRDNHIPHDAPVDALEIKNFVERVREEIPGFELTVKFRCSLNELLDEDTTQYQEEAERESTDVVDDFLVQEIDEIPEESKYEMCCWFTWREHESEYLSDCIYNWFSSVHEEWEFLFEARNFSNGDEGLPWRTPEGCWQEVVNFVQAATNSSDNESLLNYIQKCRDSEEELCESSPTSDFNSGF